MRRGIPVALTAEEAGRALERGLAAARADLRELTAGFSAEDREVQGSLLAPAPRLAG